MTKPNTPPELIDWIRASIRNGDKHGLENNTLILGALGWRGFWVGAEPLAFDSAPLRRLAWRQAWITRDNAPGLAAQGLSSIGARAPDLLSVDLDGNDLHVVRRLLESGLRPRLFIVEYNAKFPPPARFQIRYDPEHRWTGDDYFGAALSGAPPPRTPDVAPGHRGDVR